MVDRRPETHRVGADQTQPTRHATTVEPEGAGSSRAGWIGVVIKPDVGFALRLPWNPLAVGGIFWGSGLHPHSVGSQLRFHAVSDTEFGACVVACLSSGRPPSLHHLRHRFVVGFVRGFTGNMQPSDSSPLPRRLRLLGFPSRPVIARAVSGEMRSPRFRRVPFVRELVSDPGRAAVPRIAAPLMLPSTF